MTLEHIPPGEAGFIAQLLQLLRAKMLRETPHTLLRDAHPKQHGLVKAVFEVEPQLPDNLQHGVFRPGAIYATWVRFSNQNAPAQNDYAKDIRGAALKLMNVPGEKIALPDGNQSSQDFVTISTAVFVTRNVQQFCGLIKALVTSKLSLLFFLLRHPRTMLNLWKSDKRHYSPLEIRYFSTTPYRLGPNQAVKYSLTPHAQATPLTHDPGPDFLRTHMREQLSQNDYRFDFCVQLRTDPNSMPIEDPGKLWRESDSPFIKVATLTIPMQAFDTPAQNLYGRDLSFNPWHSLPAHQPLGGINRARKVIYEALSQFRHNHNQIPRSEPTDYQVPNIEN